MSNMFKPVEITLPAEQNFWTRCKAFWLQDAEELLSRDAEEVLNGVWQKIHDFLFQEITFGKKNDDQIADPASEIKE